MSTALAETDQTALGRIVQPHEAARAWRTSAAAYAVMDPKELRRLVEQDPRGFHETLLNVEAQSDDSRDALIRATIAARDRVDHAEAVQAAGGAVRPGTDEWRRQEQIINALPGLRSHHDSLRLVLERAWPTRASLRAGLRAVWDHLLPMLERRAVEALDESLLATRTALLRSLSIASSFEATVARAAEVTGVNVHRRRFDPAALSTLRAAAAVSFVPRHEITA